MSLRGHAQAAGAIALLGAITFAANVASRGDDQQASSRAAFERMDTVLTGPRCQNCHTLTDFPRQGDERQPHRLGVLRGPENHGALGLTCAACHGDGNNRSSGVPGARDWGLAPLSMGWERLTPAARCHQLKDPTRNGGRNAANVIDHLKTPLVT
ncbi:MAG: hypothetical protein ACR2FH_07535, partial [Caulobacteraceae bacterium]